MRIWDDSNFFCIHILLEKYATEMHQLGREILGFTKLELDKLKNKIG